MHHHILKSNTRRGRSAELFLNAKPSDHKVQQDERLFCAVRGYRFLQVIERDACRECVTGRICPAVDRYKKTVLVSGLISRGISSAGKKYEQSIIRPPPPHFFEPLQNNIAPRLVVQQDDDISFPETKSGFQKIFESPCRRNCRSARFHIHVMIDANDECEAFIVGMVGFIRHRIGDQRFDRILRLTN